MTVQTSPSQKHSIDRAADFVTEVLRLCEDPGNRAALRSGLGRPLDRCHRMHRVIAPRVPVTSSDGERAYYAVAAMIAALPPQARGHLETDTGDTEDATEAGDGTADEPEQERVAPSARRRDFGQCLAEGVARGVLRENTAETKLNLLTRQSVDGIHRHLPGVVRVLANEPSAVDWAQLLNDLYWWQRDRDRITRRWLQSFYRTRFETECKAADAADAREHDAE